MIWFTNTLADIITLFTSLGVKPFFLFEVFQTCIWYLSNYSNLVSFVNLNLSPGLSHFFLLEGKGLVLLNFCRVFELETVHSICFFFFFTSLVHPVTHIKTNAFCSSVLGKGHFDMQIWGAMDPLSNLLITKRLALPSEPLNRFVDDDNSEYEFSLCVFWSGRFPWHEYFYWIVCLSFSLKHCFLYCLNRWM